MNPIERGSTLIAIKELRFAGRQYRPADKFDYRRMGIAHRRSVAQMLKLKKLDELTPETMKTALRFREEGAGPPRGFTLAGLKGMNILTDEQIQAHGWGNRDQDAEVTDESEADAAVARWEAPEGSWKVFAEGSDEEKSTDDTTLWVVPFRNGNRGAFRYFVHDLDGEKLNGDASIGGKDNAEKWAREWMAERAARAAAGREGDPDWSTFPENEDDWTDAQVAEFDAWYDALQPGAVEVEHQAVNKLVAERRGAEAEEARILAAKNDQTGDQPGTVEGLTQDEMAELLEAMTDEELRAHVAQLTGKDVSELEELTPLALREMAQEHQASAGNQQNGGDVQSGPSD